MLWTSRTNCILNSSLSYCADCGSERVIYMKNSFLEDLKYELRDMAANWPYFLVMFVLGWLAAGLAKIIFHW